MLNKEDINLLRKALQATEEENKRLKNELARAKNIIQGLSKSQKVSQQRERSARGKLKTLQIKYEKVKREKRAAYRKLKKANLKLPKISTTIFKPKEDMTIVSIKKTREQVFAEMRAINLQHFKERIVQVLGVHTEEDKEALDKLMAFLDTTTDEELRAIIKYANLKETYYASQTYDVGEVYGVYNSIGDLYEAIVPNES